MTPLHFTADNCADCHLFEILIAEFFFNFVNKSKTNSFKKWSSLDSKKCQSTNALPLSYTDYIQLCTSPSVMRVPSLITSTKFRHIAILTVYCPTSAKLDTVQVVKWQIIVANGNESGWLDTFNSVGCTHFKQFK